MTVSVDAVFPPKRDRDVKHRPSLASRKLEETGKVGNFGNFGKAMKHTKDLKGKFGKGKTLKKKSGKTSKKGKGDNFIDDDLFTDDFWQGQCFFNYFGFGGGDDYYPMDDYYGMDDHYGMDDYNGTMDDHYGMDDYYGTMDDQYGMDDYYGTMDDQYGMDDHYGMDDYYGVPDMEELAKCVETFAENTYLKIDTEKALDCSESMEKIAWQSYPSCFELMYYTPYVCEELYQEFDKVYQCAYEVIYQPPCYFEYISEPFDGCAIHFANTVGLDVDQVLDCTIDLFDVFEEQCYFNENSMDACDTFEQCESLLYGTDYCAYGTGIDPSDVVGILEQELEVTDFLDSIYDGSVDLAEALLVLEGYDGWNNTNGTEFGELEWSGFVECVAYELSYLLDDYCFLEEEVDIIGGCVELFAGSFGLDTEALLTCELDIEVQFIEKCELDDTNMDVCSSVEQCGNAVYGINDCAESILEVGFSDLSETLAGSEFSNLLSSLYNGTADISSVFQSLVEYDGPMGEESIWEPFIICIGDYMTYF
eukprot:CAMPEP_0116086550 /NCGR_PEP_ID=MMETSP0327-20121206/4913_1 /TAXON_ID=44447 /ORGANISM="Pseudo-nitzschia delicatissima, Strain B596" /LENGTH=533 /DNA_ID=CAMNT_0003577605 /DNA_START=2722 /DNA_END=4323 /DNA_ORIENTATION=-